MSTPPRTPHPEVLHVRARCDICRAMLARAGAPTATPCRRCGALLDSAAATLESIAASLREVGS
jgi:ribosomal protein L40E